MQLKDNVEKKYERKNRFNGQSVMLTAEEARRHDNIFINELAATLEDQGCRDRGLVTNWKAVMEDLDWFMSTMPKLIWSYCYLISPGAGRKGPEPTGQLGLKLKPQA